MHLIGYMSKSRIPESESDRVVTEIVSEAQLRNIGHGITGILFCQQGHFIQLIEGYQATVRDLVHQISQDPRHSDLHIFLDEQLLNRTCPEWSMVSINLDRTGGLDHRLLHHIGEIRERNVRIEARGFAHSLRDFLSLPAIAINLTG